MLAPLVAHDFVTLVFVTAGCGGTASLATTLRRLRPALARLAAERRALAPAVQQPLRIVRIALPEPRSLAAPPRIRARRRVHPAAKPTPYRALLKRAAPQRRRG